MLYRSAMSPRACVPKCSYQMVQPSSLALAADPRLVRSALMHLLGPGNWWLPGRLDRIMPHLSVEPADEALREPLPEAVTEDGALAGRI